MYNWAQIQYNEIQNANKDEISHQGHFVELTLKLAESR